jgi:hypothetical protein
MIVAQMECVLGTLEIVLQPMNVMLVSATKPLTNARRSPNRIVPVVKVEREHAVRALVAKAVGMEPIAFQEVIIPRVVIMGSYVRIARSIIRYAPGSTDATTRCHYKKQR